MKFPPIYRLHVRVFRILRQSVWMCVPLGGAVSSAWFFCDFPCSCLRVDIRVNWFIAQYLWLKLVHNFIFLLSTHTQCTMQSIPIYWASNASHQELNTRLPGSSQSTAANSNSWCSEFTERTHTLSLTAHTLSLIRCRTLLPQQSLNFSLLFHHTKTLRFICSRIWTHWRRIITL